MSQKADTLLRGTENEADVINLTVTVGDCWHIRTISDFNIQKVTFSDLHCLNITVLHDFALFRQLK